ncbi:MAG: UDP-N-acetylmuramyl peptide synthase [Tatlockia sp.]|jgi:cyanophycin synthetase
MDRNLRLLYQGAKALNLPVKYLPDICTLTMQFGRTHYYFHRTVTPLNKGANTVIAKNKFLCNQLLQQAGFPVPKAVVIDSQSFQSNLLAHIIQGLRFPLVAKPAQDTGRGANVLCNIKDMESLTKHLARTFHYYPAMQIEEFHTNLKEYRVLVLKKRVIGVVERFAAYVVGDGKSTIQELIDIKNALRAAYRATLTISPMIVDEEYRQCMAEQEVMLETVPLRGQKIQLCHTVNTGRGGEIYSHGRKIHPRNVHYFRNAAKTLGLNCVGFDVLCEDLNRPLKKTKWLIIEANYNPDLTIHEMSNQGEKTPVANKMLRQLIYKHPFFYLYLLCTQSQFSLYIKSLTSIALLVGLLSWAKKSNCLKYRKPISDKYI